MIRDNWVYDFWNKEIHAGALHGACCVCSLQSTKTQIQIQTTKVPPQSESNFQKRHSHLTFSVRKDDLKALTGADGYWDSPLRACSEINDLEWRITLKIDPISVMQWCPLIDATSKPIEPM